MKLRFYSSDLIHSCRQNQLGTRATSVRARSILLLSCFLHSPHRSIRANIEKQIAAIAKGQATFEAVLSSGLAALAAQFEAFVTNIAKMDELFEAAFTKIESTEGSSLRARCGKCRRYMKCVDLRDDDRKGICFLRSCVKLGSFLSSQRDSTARYVKRRTHYLRTEKSWYGLCHRSTISYSSLSLSLSFISSIKKRRVHWTGSSCCSSHSDQTLRPSRCALTATRRPPFPVRSLAEAATNVLTPPVLNR